MRVLLSAFLVLVCSSCDRGRELDDSVVLRISAPHGLRSFHNPQPAGSTAYAHDLAFVSPYDYRVEHPGATSVALYLENLPVEQAAYCAKLCIRGKPRITAATDHCLIEFGSERDKAAFLSRAALETGPFWFKSQTPADAAPGDDVSQIVLQDACDLTEIDEIHIHTMHVDEEWKSLFAREIDVVPGTSIFHLARFEGMGSVNIHRIPASFDLALYFNTARSPWSDRDLRRTIATATDRNAVARVVCNAPECIVDAPAVTAPEARVQLPATMSIILLASDSGLTRAAEAMAYHLNEALSIEVPVEALPLGELLTRVTEKRDFDAVLLPMSRYEFQGRTVTLPDRIAAITGYRDEAFARADADGDGRTFEAILARDVPAVRLFANLHFAAVDEYFTLPEGSWPISNYSWRWMAYLVPASKER